MSGKHKGGFGEIHHGTVDGGADVTVAFGWGSREGHTLIADGHVNAADFYASGGHDHYGAGNGPNNNGTARGAYNGPAA